MIFYKAHPQKLSEIIIELVKHVYSITEGGKLRPEMLTINYLETFYSLYQKATQKFGPGTPHVYFYSLANQLGIDTSQTKAGLNAAALPNKDSKINVQANLIKTIIDEIYKNRQELERYQLASGNKFGLKFLKSGSFYYPKSEPTKISPNNLAKFFGVTGDTLKKWLKDINNPNFNLGSNHEIMFRKIRSSIVSLFRGSTKGINIGKKAILSAINLYISKYFQQLDYITKLTFHFDENADWDSAWALSETQLSKKMHMGKSYLGDIKRRDMQPGKDFDEYSKYFRLAVNLLLLRKTDISFKSDLSYHKFRKNSIELIFQEILDSGLLEEDLKPQFEALVYILYALSVARINKYGSIDKIPKSGIIDGKNIKFKHHKNPNGIVDLSQLSIMYGYGSRRQTLAARLSENLFFTPEMVSDLKILVKKFEADAKKECNVAELMVDTIPRYQVKSRPSYVGIISHPILEDLINRLLNALKIESMHEMYCNRPHSNHKIDTAIDLSSLKSEGKNLLRKIFKDKFNIALNQYDEIFIDYTIPSKQKIQKVMDKVEIKPYVSKKRLTLILFYGPYSQDSFSLVSQRLKRSNIQFKENIHFIDCLNFIEELDNNGKFSVEMKSMEQNIYSAIRDINSPAGEQSLKTLEALCDHSLSRLKQSNRYLNL